MSTFNTGRHEPGDPGVVHDNSLVIYTRKERTTDTQSRTWIIMGPQIVLGDEVSVSKFT